MASLSPKGTDIKKSIGTKTVLSPNNSFTEKTFNKSPLKSPSKLKSPVLKGNESGKTTSTVLKAKMDSSSPPKVARTPSAKSISPPNKTSKNAILSTPGAKLKLDKSNSQGDIAVNPNLKNSVSGIIPLDNAPTEVDRILETTLEGTVTESISTDQKDEPQLDKPQNDSSTVAAQTLTNGDSVSDVKDLKNSKPDSFHEKQILNSEQKHASGDNAPSMNEKIEHKESAGEGFVADKEKLDYENFTQQLPSNEVVSSAACKVESVESTSVSVITEIPETKVEEEMDLPIENQNEQEANNASTPKESPNSSVTDCNCSTETAKLVSESETPEEEVTKQSIREKVWKHLESNDLVLFPRPCNGRIPNFKGAHAAAEKLSATKVFKNSKTIKINPDKAQELARFHVLEHGKRLLVPIPRLREGLFQAVVPPTDAMKFQLQQASQRYGMKKWSKPVSLEDKVSIDMVVLGSVAVDKKGHRIGKGEGFADLEFAMLVKMNAVNENTIIVTTVHDDQVFDELPDNLFKEHDVPVDWIITPTQIIEVTEKLPRPKGIIWNILSNRRILEIPILQKLKEQEQSEGQECTLKEVDSDVEEKSYPQESVFNKRFTRRRRFNNYSRSTGDPIRDSKLAAPTPFYNRPRRFSPNQNRMGNFNDVRRYDGPPPRRGYYQAPYGVKQPVNGRPMMRRPRSMNRPGQMMGGNRNINRPKSMNRPQSAVRVPQNRQHSNNRQAMNNNALTKSVEVQTVDKKVRPSRPFVKRKRAPIEFSLRVKNIGTGVRVRDLKSALNERGIKPRDITWRGYRGFAFLHFVKSASKEDNKPLVVEDVIHALQGLPLPPKNKKALVIEPAKPKKSTIDEVENMNLTFAKATNKTEVPSLKQEAV